MAQYSMTSRKLRAPAFKAKTLFLLAAGFSLAQCASLPRSQDLVIRQDDLLSSGIRKPPQMPYVWNDTEASLEQLAVNYNNTQFALLDHLVGTVTPETATFENAVLPYLQQEGPNRAAFFPMYAYSLGPSAKIAAAMNNVDSQINDAYDLIFTNASFFALVDAVYQANDPSLSEEDTIALASLWGEFGGNGLNIPAGAPRNNYNNITDRINEIQGEYNANLGADEVNVYFTAEELEGVPAEIIATYKNATGANAGKYEINVALLQNFYDISQNAINETTRYVALTAANRQSPENVPLIQETAGLHLQEANLFNYSTYADYTISFNIAKNASTVAAFLEDLRKNIAPLAQSDLDGLNAIKANDSDIISPIGETDIVYDWDADYYTQIETMRDYSVDDEMIKAYFPVNVTIPAILAFYGDIYGLRFDRIQGQDADELSPTGNGSDLVWQEDVMMYTVWDTPEFCDAYPENVTDNGFIGFLYLDLFYRPIVKDGQSAYEEMLIPGYVNADGSYNYPTVAVVTNFQKSTNENLKPSLLEYGDLPTIMHELGHSMHNLLSITQFARTHGTTGVPIDFVEFPSQFMENWSRVPEALSRISCHWSSFSPEAAATWKQQQGSNFTGSLPPVTMPPELITQVINSTNVLKGLGTMSQIFFAEYDQALYTLTSEAEVQSLDPTVLYNQLGRNITEIPDDSDIGKGFNNTNGETTFVHIVSNYAGNYYGYQWCLVYAQDVFYTKFINDPFNSAMGFLYRTTVLQPGGARDPLVSLSDFLGRAPNNEAYYEYLGIDISSS